MTDKIKKSDATPVVPHRVWAVSACLLGASCRYDGQSASAAARSRVGLILHETHVPICPEMLGGLAAPRVPAQIEGGTGADVLRGEAWIRNGNGEDVTHAFVRGAEKAFEIATQVGATHACLKARSPSCGVGEVHSRAGLRPGDGVAAARLKQAGLKVCSDETLASFLREDDASESDNSR